MSKRFLLALLMPIALIIAVLAITEWSKHHVHPTQDFLFSLTDNSLCASGKYTVQHQRLVWSSDKKTPKLCQKTTTPKLFRYHTILKQAEAVHLKEVKSLQINTNQTSQDGFHVVSGRQSAFVGLLSTLSSNDAVYLVGNGASEIIPLPENNQHATFDFLGWIQS